MSRLGKQPIVIPSGVTVKLEDGLLTVKGPKGELTRTIHPFVRVRIMEKEIRLEPANETELSRALWGTFFSHISNMMKGVIEGYTKTLLIEGVGYRATLKGKDLELALGFSHPVPVKAEEGIAFTVEKNSITITGISKELVGNVSATIRALKKPEPYKGKGIRYQNEVVRRKSGKKAVGSGS